MLRASGSSGKRPVNAGILAIGAMQKIQESFNHDPGRDSAESNHPSISGETES
jgi:hypothetical protein